jgi:TRAP transporter TAXI family solute receptor
MLKTLTHLALAATVAVTAGQAAAQGRITIGTNPQGSLYYTVGGGMAAALQGALQRPVTVQPFTGSSVYIPLLAAGEVTVGINSSIDMGGWYRGDYGNEPISSLRMLARLWPLRIALTARADSGMTEIKDLAGKRVVTDYSSLAAVGLVNQATLLAGGVELDEVERVTVSGLQPGMDGLVENDLDATGVAVGIPMTQQAHATIPGGIVYLSVTGDNATSEFINSVFPGVYLMTVDPSPRMPEVIEPVTVPAYDVYLTTDASLPDDEARAILEALYDALPQLKQDYPAIGLAQQDLMAQPSNTVPYHPAAVTFFEEKGLWSAENEERDASLAQ